MKSDNRESKNTAIGRRQFLKRTAFATAAATAFPAIIPSRAYGAAGGVAPSNRLAIGMIGMGTMNRGHLANALRHPAVQVVALADVESTRLEACKAQVEKVYGDISSGGSYKGCEIYMDFRDLLARPDIDAVMIATPDHWHSIPSVLAAKAGKDIYCEKPMVHSVEEGRAVVKAVRRYGRVFQTGSQQRSDFDQYFVNAAELVRNGAIGDVKAIDIGVGGPARDCTGLPAQPVPPTMNWDMWLGPAPWRPYNWNISPMNYGHFPDWRSYRSYGGGSLSDFGAHNFDIAQWAMNMDDSGPVKFVHPDDREGPDKRMMMVYANGVPMYHGLNPETKGVGGSYCVFYGTKGTIFVSRDFLRADPENIVKMSYGENGVRLNRRRTHFDDWMESIKTRQKPIADVEIGHRTATICALANICYQIGRSFDWDPVAERVPNDVEANRSLGYTFRAPYSLDI